ncbi:MAG: hypothetical protein JJE30_11185 [Desulfuromonadales bacterium]|nr:hypothetical protein [Desulfuromonadales bacterium]
MPTGGSKSFTATVTGASNTAVIWSVIETGGGSVSSAGVYTAPSTAGTYHVKAASVADPSKSATAAVTVTAPTPFPIGTWVGPHNIVIKVDSFYDASGFNNYYSGSVSFPVFSGGIINVSGSFMDAGGSINYVQKNALAVSVQSFNGNNITYLTFSGDGTIDYNMKPPITSLSGLLVTVSTIPGNSYSERITLVKQ